MPTYRKFELPDAGEGLTEADIVQWHIAVGDTVAINDTIVEIETAKSLVELPSPFAGTVAEIVVPAGQTANVGDVIVVIDIDPDGANEPSGDDDVTASTNGHEASDTATPSAAAGSAVASATPAETTTPTPAGGTSSATTATRAEDASAPAKPAASGTGDSSSGSVLVGYGTADAGGSPRRRRAQAAPAATHRTHAEASRTSPHVLAKPPVRLLARELGIDLASVISSGPGGVITREDVLAHQRQAEARNLATYPGDDQPWLADGEVSPDGRQTRVPVRSVRKRTAEAMAASAFTAPHVTVFHTVDVTKTMRLVAQLKADREFSGVRVTPLLVAMKALLMAVDRHPEINASWDDAAQQIVYKHYVNLGIAAATPRGLVVPNIKDAHRLGMLELAQALGELTATARTGKTRPQDMSDGTITITNVGVFGIDSGTPILNPGEAGILAFGAIREMPWVHRGKIKIRHVTQLALSFDHRLVDGELGSRVLADVAAILQDPARGLVWG